MATKKKTITAVEQTAVEPVATAENPAVQPETAAAEVQAPVVEAANVIPPLVQSITAPLAGLLEPIVPKAIGTQFLQLISKDADGNEIKAMQIGQRGVVVVCGFLPVFIPGADIVDRGNGKQIV